MKTYLLAFAGMAMISSSALADDMKPAMKADMKADGKMMKMEAPKPAPEMEAMTKAMAGKWKCTTKMMMPPDQGGTIEGKSTVTFKSELNGFALMGEIDVAKSKMMPGSKAMIHIGYDATKKMFMQGYADDMGNSGMDMSKGMEGDKLVWDGEGQMMGKSMKTRMTLTMKGPKEISTVHEADMGDGKWVSMLEESCKK